VKELNEAWVQNLLFIESFSFISSIDFAGFGKRSSGEKKRLFTECVAFISKIFVEVKKHPGSFPCKLTV